LAIYNQRWMRKVKKRWHFHGKMNIMNSIDCLFVCAIRLPFFSEQWTQFFRKKQLNLYLIILMTQLYFLIMEHNKRGIWM
ncbi:putative LTR transposable element, partial [Pseudoloma neurophilia]